MLTILVSQTNWAYILESWAFGGLSSTKTSEGLIYEDQSHRSSRRNPTSTIPKWYISVTSKHWACLSVLPIFTC